MMTRPAIAAVLFSLVAAAMFAQAPTSTLVGRVTIDGKPLAGVTITATSPILLGARTTTSGASGNYVLLALPPGVYDVEFAREGMITVTHKAILRLAQTSRVDNEMKASDVAESVTVTASSEPLMQTPAIATTFDDALIDRLPMRRGIVDRVQLAPGVRSEALVLVDGIRVNREELERIAVDEALDETTILNGGISAEYDRFDGGVIATITKSGSNELHGSARADFDDDRRPRNIFEGTLGGRIVEDRLWLFGAARAASDDRRFQAKANELITPNQTLVASYLNSADARDFLSGQYTATLPHDITIEAVAARDDHGNNTLDAKAHYVIATHELVAGFDRHALFINDRWSFNPRWSFNLGVRRDDNAGSLSPRLGVVRELGEDGTQRITMSYGRYATSNGSEIDELTAGYGKQLGNEGYVRADAVHRDDYDALLIQGTYRLLGHLTLGGNYTWSSLDEQRNHANAWAQFDMPFKDGELNLALLDQYDDEHNKAGITIGYAMPIHDITTFAKADWFDSEVKVAIGARF
ncbi:MAG: hypothetical protein QOI24_2963 [Acidobacteriota bacterium]|jgi:hypothetical protein|nr:hypothetical protein [Acidobacteriota bacterium]